MSSIIELNEILNTNNSTSRDEALDKIIHSMNKSLSYKPLWYKLEQSGCSCCLAEYFYLVCKIEYEYKILVYHGYISHSNKCAGIRCTCGNPFIWKNINPIEKTVEDYELEYFLKTLISIEDDIWKDEYKLFLEQQKDYKNDYFIDKPLKNYSYYFK